MTNNEEKLKDLLASSLSEISRTEFVVKSRDIELSKPRDVSHGDVATNAALKFWKQMGMESSVATANALVQNVLGTDSKVDANISDMNAAGPGFVNIVLSSNVYSETVQTILNEGNEFGSRSKVDENVIVEFSSPNIAKPFTIGHLRSTVIGESIARLYEFSGYSVFRDNHLGDWGAAFGKQLFAFEYFDVDLESISSSDAPVKALVDLYIRINAEIEKDNTLQEIAREWFKKLENGDKKARELWKFCIDISLKKFEEYYKLLDIHFTENNGKGFGESYFEEEMQIVIRKLEQAASEGLIEYRESEGAMLVFFPKASNMPPLMILKSNGTTLYSTRDLATDHFRMNHSRYGHPNLTVINEVGGEQKLYWEQIFFIEEALGWYKKGQRIHKGHGLIRFKEGKMSTRKGNVIWLSDVLNEAYARVDAISSEEIEEEDKWSIAIGAIKWNDLRRESELNVTFDWDEVVNIKGNSGPYIQYTYTRAFSILQNAGKVIISKEISFTGEHETEVAKLLGEFPKKVEEALEKLAPNILCNYLFELSQSFNRFYNEHRVLDVEDQLVRDSRIALTSATAEVIQNGLKLLGIKTVERM